MRESIAILRKKVLTMAVSGQLVHQDPTDGTGEELHQAIQKARAEAAKTAAARKKNAKPLPVIMPEENPFEIPSSWKWVRLSSLGKTYTGKTPRTANKENFNGEIPFIGPGDIQGSKIVTHSKLITEQGAKESVMAESGDVLMVCIGGTIGKTALVYKPTTLNQQINGIRPIITDSIFIHRVFQSNYFYELVWQKSSGGATPILNMGRWSECVVPLPPLAEQQRIVAKVDEIMATLDTLEAEAGDVEELLNALEKRILSEAVAGKLVPQDSSEGTGEELYQAIQKARAEAAKTATGRKKNAKPLSAITADEIPFEIPSSWKWVRLGDVTNYGSAEKCKPEKITDGTWVLELEDIDKDGRGLLSKRTYPERKSLSDKNVFFEGDVLYGKLRPYLNKVICATEGGIASSELLPLRFFGANSGNYLRLVLLSAYFSSHVNQRTYGMKMPRLGTEDGRKASIPLPPLAEQQRIVAKVDEAVSLIRQLREAIT